MHNTTLPRPKVGWNGFIGSFLVAPDNGFVAQLPIRVARWTKKKEQPLSAAAISRREINDSHYKLSDHDCCS